MFRQLLRKEPKKRFLGPCIGEVTPSSAKLWLHYPLLEGDAPRSVVISIHEGAPDAPAAGRQLMTLSPRTLGSGTVVFDRLKSDQLYYYRIWEREGVPLELDGVAAEDLHFRTFTEEFRPARTDFVILSCHDPPQVDDDGYDGFRVWAAIDPIRRENDVRFAILLGDQIYGDHAQEELLRERDEKKRLQLYLDVYQRLWDNPHYRKALCSLPAYLMWDDHDITDGWGSRSDSFLDAASDRFRPEWIDLFQAARKCFLHLQASRNPAPLREGDSASFDFCFRVGKVGFAIADLRSNRNHRRQRMWSAEQFEAIRDWVAVNRADLEALFFVSPVVVTHGWPQIERKIRELAPFMTKLTELLRLVPLIRKTRWADRLVKRNLEDLAGFRDDLEDAWSSDPNNAQAEELLDFLFELQNPNGDASPVPVIILSGDIHAAGYSIVYSFKPEHRARPVIEHVCSSPIASKPMHWMVEALYENDVRTVPIGTSGSYFGQVSHHHCHRNVVVCSLRRYDGEELRLKLKYYLEGKPQPEIIVSDLRRVSHAEVIDWESPRGRGGVPRRDQAA